MEELIQCVLQQIPRTKFGRFTLKEVEGPVRFDSSWVPGGDRRVLRPGIGAADLWAGCVMWQETSPQKAFTVIGHGPAISE